MSRIDTVLKNLKDQDRTAFVPFSVAGYPDYRQSLEIFQTLCAGDIVEFGYPFSDPTADGPVIQAAASQAIKNGMNLDKAFDMIGSIRENTTTPIIFFSYFNPIHKYGVDRFVSRACEAGVDGLLMVDLPMEESHHLKPQAEKAGIDWIYLITPTTPVERIKKMDDSGSGFLYYVSVLGVTGARAALPTSLADDCRRIREITRLPLVVGFGISGPEQAIMLKPHVDGVVVGSAIVSMAADQSGVAGLQAWVNSMKDALR